MTVHAEPTPIDPSFVDDLPRNVAVQFLERASTSASAEAYRYPVGEQQEWDSVTWAEAAHQVRRLAAGLVALGVEPEQRVAIASGTRYEWVLADLAVMCAGAATTTVYPTTHAEDTAHILEDSASRVVLAEDDEQVDKLLGIREQLPEVLRVVRLTPGSPGSPGAGEDWVMDLEELAGLGDERLRDQPGMIEQIAAEIDPDQLATLIYTSGTTGRPKGVRLRHRAWVYQGEAIRAMGILDETDLQLLWLPMAHSFGKVLLSTQLACGFPTAIDGRVERIVDNLGVVRPTFMGAAPRIFEKAHGRIVTMTASEGGAKQKIFERAFEVGLEVDRRRREGHSVPWVLRAQHAVLDRLVLAKVRERFGGRVRFFISGSAALNDEIAHWFHAAGITILEGYGLTENAAGGTVNRLEAYRIGTVGPALPGAEVRIGEGEEVQMRGPHIMEGYHNLPEETAATLTDDGWLRTGDKGSLDAGGYLRITGRIKDLFKTSGGKYVAPSAIDSTFKAICPYASQLMVFGNERHFVVALIALDADAMAGWAAENDMTDRPFAEVVASPAAQAMVADYVEQLNARLNRWEQVKRWEVLDHDLSIESGELTPSMKVRRSVVEENHSALIDSFYDARPAG